MPRLLDRLYPLAVALAAVTVLLDWLFVALTITCLQDAGGGDCLTLGLLATVPLLSSMAGLALVLSVRAQARTNPGPLPVVRIVIGETLLVAPFVWLAAPLLANPF